jgi:hypothetical protein
MGSAVALLGFAGAANASATVDLIWIDVSATTTGGIVICTFFTQRNCPQFGSTLTGVDASDTIALVAILTAGPTGSIGASISADYSDALPKLDVITFSAMTTTSPFFYLPLALGTIQDTGTQIQELNAGALPDAGAGQGLPPGETAYLGTVTFHKDSLINGTFDIIVDAGTIPLSSGANLIDINGTLITPTTTFNSATLVNVPEPGALSLLVMGLGGMLLAGRGRRS